MRYFFHNRYDRHSIEMLNSLPPDTQIFDVFGGDKIPEGYRVCVLPYFIDKSLELVTQGPFLPGIFTLRWQCVDANRLIYTQGQPSFHITVNTQMWDAVAVDGILEIEIECLLPGILKIQIENNFDGFHPWRGTIEVTNE